MLVLLPPAVLELELLPQLVPLNPLPPLPPLPLELPPLLLVPSAVLELEPPLLLGPPPRLPLTEEPPVPVEPPASANGGELLEGDEQPVTHATVMRAKPLRHSQK